jgi:actin-related protein
MFAMVKNGVKTTNDPNSSNEIRIRTAQFKRNYDSKHTVWHKIYIENQINRKRIPSLLLLARRLPVARLHAAPRGAARGSRLGEERREENGGGNWTA